jgi:hypothetical protein
MHNLKSNTEYNLVQSPDEGGGWIPHTPGDPMPCDANSFVEVLVSTGHIGPSLQASERLWDKGKGSNIIGWRPALDMEVAL